jgi:proteasome lid subunit RPN8/RPN11
VDAWNYKCRIDLQEIILKQAEKKILSQYSENQKPNESCAILFGKNNQVLDVFLTENIDESPVNFTISNKQLIEGYKIAEDKKMDVIGIFHSHPNSDAFPSNTDKKFMQSNPVVWIIYSGINKNFRAFILESDTIEIPIKEK